MRMRLFEIRRWAIRRGKVRAEPPRQRRTRPRPRSIISVAGALALERRRLRKRAYRPKIAWETDSTNCTRSGNHHYGQRLSAYKVEIIHSRQDLGSCRAICPGSSPGARTRLFEDLESPERLLESHERLSQSAAPSLPERSHADFLVIDLGVGLDVTSGGSSSW